MDKKMGIVGLTGSFRENLSDIKDESKIVFTGSVAVCTPFIELLSYSVRDKNHDLVYIPKSEIENAKIIKMQPNIGFSVVDEKADPLNPEAIVVLGGLAMPKFGCAPEDILKMIEELSKEKKPKIIGVCFMNIFEKAGWDKKLEFDILIDTTLETVVK